MASKYVRPSQRAAAILQHHTDAVSAGVARSQRNEHLYQARRMKDKGLRRMFVDFAKDTHRQFLMHLRECKRYDDRRAALAASIAAEEHALRVDMVRHLTQPIFGDHTDEWIS